MRFPIVPVNMTVVLSLVVVDLVTHVTLELRRLIILFVLQFMSVESRLSHYHLTANVTRDSRVVVLAHVHRKRLFPKMVISFSANVTTVRDFGVLVNFPVRVETVLIFETRVAQIALERSPFRVRNAVQSQLPVFFEALAAHDARVIFALVHVKAMLP